MQSCMQLTVEVPPPSCTPMSGPDSSSNAKASMSVSLHPDFILDLASTSLIGSRAKLQDIPKVEQLIIGRIRNYVIENFVWPKVRTFNLPKVGGSKKLSPTGELAVPKMDLDASIDTPENDSDNYVTVNGKRINPLDSEDMLRSPSVSSTAGDEEDEEYDEDNLLEEEGEEEDSDLADDSQPQRRPSTRGVHEGRLSNPRPSRAGVQTALKFEGHSSAVEAAAHTSDVHRRLRRGSSLSSSTTASDLLASSRRTSGSSSATPAMLAFSPPGLSASSRSEAGSAYSAQDIRRHVPLHSPGLGIGLKPGPSKRHSIQAYLPHSGSSQNGQYSPFPPISSAYSNHLSRTPSVTSLPTLLSPRADQPSASKLAALLDSQNPTLEAERNATRETSPRETRDSGKKKRPSPRKSDDPVYSNPTTRSKSRPT